MVGYPGVGKRTIVEGIAELMVGEDVPDIFQDKRLVSMSVSGLIAGASKTGDLEDRVLTVMSEISRSKNIILFVEDIHHLVGISTDSGEAMDVAEVLAEQMQRGNFHVIATTTPEYYKQYIEKSSLAKVLQKVLVGEPELDEAIHILESKALQLETKNQVYFSYNALADAIKYSKEYLHEEFLPEKAVRLITEAALTVKELRGIKTIVSAEDIANLVSTSTGIPVSKISTDESKKLLNLEERLHERVVGQNLAINLVASALRRARTALRGGDKPIASFLFLGPTGVGKTQIAKTLANVYFGSEKNMIRVDMSEFQSSDALAKLIGDAQSGTVGFLSEAVRQKPFSLILLDEIEKATPEILNVFLQVLDDGRLTDATGRTIDFTNSIIIGTSNAGTSFIQDGIKAKKSLESIREELINVQLQKYFRPEFLNRFDGVVVFHPLELEHVAVIAKIFIGDLAKRLEEKGIYLEAEEAAIAELARLGFDPAFGARPLRRVIQDRVEDNLAKMLLAEKIGRRDKVILKQDLSLDIIKAPTL